MEKNYYLITKQTDKEAHNMKNMGLANRRKFEY